MSRRQFNRLIIASTAAFALSDESGGEEPASRPSDPMADHALASIKHASPVPLTSEQEQKIRESLQSQNKTAQTLRSVDLPEGSEPAFVFRVHGKTNDRNRR